MDDTQIRVKHPPKSGFTHIASSFTAPLAIALGYYIGARLGFCADARSNTGLHPVAAKRHSSGRPGYHPPTLLAARAGRSLRRRISPSSSRAACLRAWCLCWFVSNCTEALLGAGLLLRFGWGAKSFETLRGTAVFLAAAFTATVASSFLDAGFVVLNGWGSADYWTIWRTRVFSNLLAAITLVPVILTTAERLRDNRRGIAAPVPRGGRPLFGARRRLLDGLCPAPDGARRHAGAALCAAAAPRRRGFALRPLGREQLDARPVRSSPSGAPHRGRDRSSRQSPAGNALAIQLFLIVAWSLVMSARRGDQRMVGRGPQGAPQRRAARRGHRRRSTRPLGVGPRHAARWNWSAGTRRMYEVGPEVPVNAETFQRLIHPDDRAADRGGHGGWRCAAGQST